MEIVLLVVGIVVGGALGWFAARSRSVTAESADTALMQELNSSRVQHATELGELRAELASANMKAEQVTEQLLAERQARAELIEQQRIEREQREVTEREEAKVLEKLAPVGDVVNKMQAKLDELQNEQTKQSTEIRAQLKNSLEVSSKLSESTQSLSRVMSDSSQRGSWGELQLERVAELSGLHKGVNYTVQKTVDGEDNRGRPDMIVYLTGNGAIAVDAKAPFSAYNDAMSAEASPEERKNGLAKHARDLRSHIQALSQRDYAKNLAGKVDYVICFVPADSMLSAALEADPELLEFAIAKKVVLTSPTSLVAVLRPVAITWVQVENAQRANEIVDMGRELYARLSTMAGFAVKLGKSIQTSSTTYNAFVGSLESRVLSAARKFDKLKIDELPELLEIDSTIQLFNTQELRGLNAELESGQPAIGDPIDAEEV